MMPSEKPRHTRINDYLMAIQVSIEEIVQQAWAVEVTISDSCLEAIDDFLQHPNKDIRGEPILAWASIGKL